MDILVKILLYCALIYGVTLVVPGVTIDTLWPTAVIAGVVFYIINIVLKPILKLVTLPINLLTLGLFSFVINAVCFWLVGYIVNGFSVGGVLPAIVGGVVASLGAWIISMLLDKDE